MKFAPIGRRKPSLKDSFKKAIVKAGNKNETMPLTDKDIIDSVKQTISGNRINYDSGMNKDFNEIKNYIRDNYDYGESGVTTQNHKFYLVKETSELKKKGKEKYFEKGWLSIPAKLLWSGYEGQPSNKEIKDDIKKWLKLKPEVKEQSELFKMFKKYNYLENGELDKFLNRHEEIDLTNDNEDETVNELVDEVINEYVDETEKPAKKSKTEKKENIKSGIQNPKPDHKLIGDELLKELVAEHQRIMDMGGTDKDKMESIHLREEELFTGERVNALISAFIKAKQKLEKKQKRPVIIGGAITSFLTNPKKMEEFVNAAKPVTFEAKLSNKDKTIEERMAEIKKEEEKKKSIDKFQSRENRKAGILRDDEIIRALANLGYTTRSSVRVDSLTKLPVNLKEAVAVLPFTGEKKRDFIYDVKSLMKLYYYPDITQHGDDNRINIDIMAPYINGDIDDEYSELETWVNNKTTDTITTADKDIIIKYIKVRQPFMDEVVKKNLVTLHPDSEFDMISYKRSDLKFTTSDFAYDDTAIKEFNKKMEGKTGNEIIKAIQQHAPLLSPEARKEVENKELVEEVTKPGFDSNKFQAIVRGYLSIPAKFDYSKLGWPEKKMKAIAKLLNPKTYEQKVATGEIEDKEIEKDLGIISETEKAIVEGDKPDEDKKIDEKTKTDEDKKTVEDKKPNVDKPKPKPKPKQMYSDDEEEVLTEIMKSDLDNSITNFLSSKNNGVKHNESNPSDYFINTVINNDGSVIKYFDRIRDIVREYKNLEDGTWYNNERLNKIVREIRKHLDDSIISLKAKPKRTDAEIKRLERYEGYLISINYIIKDMKISVDMKK